MPTTSRSSDALQDQDAAPDLMTESPSADGLDRLLAAEIAAEVQFLIARASGRGNAHANSLLAELGLKVRHYTVLSLACSDLQPSQRELGEFLNLDPSQIVALVDHLEARGAVRRETDPRDRRSKIVVATDTGRALNDRARAITQRSEDDVLSTLSPRERKQLRALLLKAAF